MEQKIVTIQIKDEFISGAGVTIGAAGSHDDVLMEMDFRSSPLWKGLAKRAIFSNALGKPCPPIILTTNLLEEGQSDVYLVPVAAEAKNVAGEVFLTVEGFVGEGKTEKIRVVTEEATFRVMPSKLYHNENTSLTPTEAEQLQAEVEQIKQDIVDAAKAANALEETKEAQTKAEEARDLSVQFANNSKGYMSMANQFAADAESEANRAQAEAERATIPAVIGVYNVILSDRVTGEKYALIVENGRLAILGVSETFDATDMTLIDSATGVSYEMLVESGKITLQEV